MRIKCPLLLFCVFSLAFSAKAQDSAQVAQTLKTLLSICRNVDFGDTNTFKRGTFYKAAPYIVYQGDDTKRKWKDVANYKDKKEKEQVDNICLKINGSVNQDSAYKIIGYTTQAESEGKWHVLVISYMRKGKERHATFAFLKIRKKFALGDID